jgi:MOSC domain-containing protein YiiM
MPCFKLNVRFRRPDMVKRFVRAGRSGFYLSVLKEGHVGAGDTIEWVPTDEEAVSVAEVAALYTADTANRDLMQRAVQTAALPQAWRDYFLKQLGEADA